ncbi:MFS general substrate transporter [Parathielavia hyrcaniae]|uniref:MFS general substrate transporter n=1 Tax=Parathielavia hyrcaniae TaxID=113614 RepID=A0AAN6T3Y1_9PEZI|nr:MFS general substrate transporter [Parathielavia hyrcaniae]
MTNKPRGRSVEQIDTALDPDTERTPLLAGTPTPTTTTSSTTPPPPHPDDAIDDSHSDSDAASQDQDDDTSPPVSHLGAAALLLRPRVILLSLALVFLIELGVGMTVPPLNAVMESIICRQMHPEVFSPPLPSPSANANATTTMTMMVAGKIRYYAGGLVLADDPACKGPDVQGYLAMLRGWANTFESIPGIVGAVPYGILSDRWGRRPLMGLSLAGIVLSYVFTYAVLYFSDVVPLWVTWFSAAFQLIGGGGAIVVAMLYTTIADVMPSDKRATVFFQLGAVFLGSQMVAGPLGGAMLVWNPWIPLLVALAILIITNTAVLAFPETVHVHDWKGPGEEQGSDEAGMPRVGKLWHKACAGLAEVWDFVLGNTSLAVLMLSLVFVVLGRFVGELLLQYATDRYGWSWSQASMVLTIRNGASLVTLLALLPVASWLCVHRLGMAGVAKDLWLSRWSGILCIVGSLTVAGAVNGALFSIGLLWLALGSGMTALIRSLINALVEEHYVGTVNTLIGFMEMVGMTVAGPLLAKSLSVGLNLGGAWIGLPFLTTGLFFVISTAMLWSFRLPTGQRASVQSSC